MKTTFKEVFPISAQGEITKVLISAMSVVRGGLEFLLGRGAFVVNDVKPALVRVNK